MSQSPARARPPASDTRLTSLDGLRGLAALVVVFNHGMLISPTLAQPFLTPGIHVHPWWAKALVYTPLHLAWAGTEAVWVFFVLSGLVLALPSAQRRQGPWLAYYPKRLTRLYVPILTAIALALLVIQLTDHRREPYHSWWLDLHPAHVPATGLWHDTTLVRGAGWTNSVLWSLQYEMIFSLLLPLFVLVLVMVRAPALLRVVVAGGLVVTGTLDGSHLTTYMGVFACGCVMARHLGALLRLGARLDRAPGVVAGLWVAAVLLTTAKWTLMASAPHGRLGFVLSVAGGVLLVWLFAATASGRSLGTQRQIAWLGSRSFSLYLVHEPILVAVAFALHRHAHPGTVLLLGVPIALAVAEVFYRAVERPSLHLARRLGRATARAQAPVGAQIEMLPTV